MKKLLGILSAVSLTVSTPSLVVACTSARITKPKLNKELAKKLLVQISGNKDLANIDFGSLFTDAEIEAVIVNMINELLSLQYSFDSTNSMFKSLDFKDLYTSDKDKGIEESFKTKYSLESRTIAENKLFEDYTKSVGTTRLDYWAIRNNYNLNIQNDKTKVNSMSGEQVEVNSTNPYIYISDASPTGEAQDSIWKFSNEQGNNGTIAGKSKLPTIEELTKEYQENGSSMFWVKNIEGEFENISAKSALYLRFQDYFESKLLEDMNDNLLTNAYLKSTMFNIKTIEEEKAPFINPSSAMFSKTQTLNETSINEYWKSNVKMVWTLKFDVTQAQTIDNINKEINKQAELLNTSSGALKEGKKISEIVKIFESGAIKPINDNKTAYDSYFGLQGYQGLTIYDGDNAIGESPIAGKAYEAKVKSWNNGPGIIKSSSENFLTMDAENNNYADLVIVLPIYMIELLGASNSEESTYNIVGKDNEETSAIKFSNTIGNDTIYKDRWNNKNNSTLHSADVAELAKNEKKQEALLNQIMFGISKDPNSSDLAKTIIYSKYLDKDDVYYAGLWDKIGTYIKSEDDKDE
ncbi:lipoprotein [Spiroplasma endosymbiont of Cantharis lateralis]|uniref:lipoprotein n=1 Tax=Spiroplasma endosymbiont of Cantharis lateralis TaxID=3066277 RepID=UPI00313D1FE7